MRERKLNDENLKKGKHFTSENAREMQLKGVEKKKQIRAFRNMQEDVFLSMLNEEFKTPKGEKVLGGDALKKKIMAIAMGDGPAAVRMIEIIAKSIDGENRKIELSGGVNLQGQTAEERKEEFNSLLEQVKND